MNNNELRLCDIEFSKLKIGQIVKCTITNRYGRIISLTERDFAHRQKDNQLVILFAKNCAFKRRHAFRYHHDFKNVILLSDAECELLFNKG